MKRHDGMWSAFNLFDLIMVLGLLLAMWLMVSCAPKRKEAKPDLWMTADRNVDQFVRSKTLEAE